MHVKKRNTRFQLYRSTYVREGWKGITHGYAELEFVGSLPVDSESVPPELASKLTFAEYRYVEGMLLRSKAKKNTEELQG
ncbi:hypothetical protein [Cupriavidus sp. TMH.W2]|uniref:hypothetical protein n=1 Tax=Cupriavidus sp. TMH.W2 TaxID=3434465 RepID=UPI003D777951